MVLKPYVFMWSVSTEPFGGELIRTYSFVYSGVDAFCRSPYPFPKNLLWKFADSMHGVREFAQFLEIHFNGFFYFF